MAQTKFKFDKDSGTLKAVSAGNDESANIKEPIHELTKNSQDSDEVSVDLTTDRTPSTDEGIVQFRENSDYTIFQVTDEVSRKTMMVIAGYGLEIKFNMAELRSTERIEQLLGGLTSMFRKMILEQALKKSE